LLRDDFGAKRYLVSKKGGDKPNTDPNLYLEFSNEYEAYLFFAHTKKRAHLKNRGLYSFNF